MSDPIPYMFPTSKKEVEALGWDYIDVILFSGDAFIDHPSFGTAVIARVLQREGYRVAIVPQPNWRDDLRDFKKLGVPRLFFGVNSGAMDSMVNHYTANKRLRHDDAYTPEGRAGQRPDYAVKVYSNILKRLYPEVPLVIGGVEASLRRLTHYDYWSDRLFPSILVDSKADFLIYGMGERTIVALANGLRDNVSKSQLLSIKQLCYISNTPPKDEDIVLLPSYEECCRNKKVFVKHFNAIELEANKLHPQKIVEPVGGKYIYVNPTFPPATEQEMDSYFALPYTKLPHPRYKGKRIPAYDMIKFSINIHRGCFGGCSFCTIAAHQGRFIQSRSEDSIVAEITRLLDHPEFKGVVSDVGAPTANMYRMQGKNRELCARCLRKSCLFPNRCPNMDVSHKNMLSLLERINRIKGVKKAFIGSGIRYDLFLDRDGNYIDETSAPFLQELILRHTSGRLKVAPEHTQSNVLKYMSKPDFSLFVSLRSKFDQIVRKNHLKYQLIPYFISSHPGCRMSDMQDLAANPHLKGLFIEQVQDFTPTPMTASSAMYYSGVDLKTLKPVFVERNQNQKKKQKALFF